MSDQTEQRHKAEMAALAAKWRKDGPEASPTWFKRVSEMCADELDSDEGRKALAKLLLEARREEAKWWRIRTHCIPPLGCKCQLCEHIAALNKQLEGTTTE